MALVRRRLVLPERASVPGEDGFRFQHALIRDAVYAGVPEARRAELHESVARALDGRLELDESVGYHLECAALLRGEAGVELRQEAGRRLGAVGVRALKRVDANAATDLLTRATALLPDDDESKLELQCALGMAAKFSGDVARADALLEEVVRKSVAAGNARIEYLARIEQAYPRLSRGELSTADVLELAEHARAIFEPAGDDFGLGRAWHCTAVVKAIYEFDYADLEATAVRIRSALRTDGLRDRERDLSHRRRSFAGADFGAGGDRALPVAARGGGHSRVAELHPADARRARGEGRVLR